MLWRELDAGTTRDALVATLVEIYGLPEEQASTDVDAFLETCRQRDHVVDEAE